ncbi:hypothetical protein NL108_013360 [Boleophthalmus pectinirostris]|nr:hypothetical protein NL108_013360 [Boleophthalmus pectinirostris]
MDLAPGDIVGKRCYQFIHAEDVEGIRQCHLDLLNKGQCVTKYYRWIQKNSGYIWIQSSATIAVNAKNNSDKNVIWVNYVLSNPEYKDTPLDLAQLPTLPEKTSETEESEESETEFKEASDNEKSEGKASHLSEHSEDPEVEAKRQTHTSQVHCSSEPEPKRPDHGTDGNSSNPESQESDESPENSENEAEDTEESRTSTGRLTRITGLGALSGIGAISALGSLGGLHIKVEHYGESEELQTRLANSSSSEEEGGEEEENLNEQESGLQECESKLQKRRKRRKSQQKWERSRRIRLSTDSPSPIPLGENATLAENLATSANSPTNSTAMSASSVLKIKTEMAEPINFDNDSSIWNYPPNREISRNEPPYSMTAKPASTNNNGTPESFPSPQGQSVAIPDSVLTPPGNDGGGGATVRKTASFNGNSTPSSSASVTSLAPPSSVSSADPLSPPLSASPRDKQQTTPTTSSTSPASSCASSAPSSSGPAVLYSGDLEALQRLQAGNVVLPLVHRVSGTLAPTSTSAPECIPPGLSGTLRPM